MRKAVPPLLLVALGLLGCVSTRPVTPPTIEVTAVGNTIALVNRGSKPVRLFYSHAGYFGDLQMFRVRFRDRRGEILPVAGTADGWFTPKVMHASLDPLPMRELVLPPGSPVEFRRDVEHFVEWVRWMPPPGIGPCEVQFRLFAYLERDGRKRVEPVSEWGPGPCPVAPSP